MDLVTIPNIEILHVGTWNISNGVFTFTEDDLRSAVAAVEDPDVKAPRLKVGHEDGRFDGEPAFGKFDNLRLSEDGQALFADMVGVPKWLADIMPIAFPNRSIEGKYNHTTNHGRNHEFILTAVSLLGVMLPGISSLPDLPLLYGAEMPEGTVVLAGAETVRASVDVDMVRRSFYEEFATEESGRYWWWCNSIQLNPMQVIAEDEDNGTLYRVPFSLSGDTVKWSDPVAVKIIYQDTTDKAAASMGGAVAAAAGHLPRPADRVRASNERSDMTPEQIAEARKKLGLGDNVSDAEVVAKLLAAVPANPGEVDNPDEGGGGNPPTPTPAPTPTPEPAPTQPAAPTQPPVEQPVPPTAVPSQLAPAAGTVTVDQASWQQTQDYIKAKQKEDADNAIKHRDKTIAAAASAGKILPSHVQNWTDRWSKDPKGTEEILASLAPVLPLHQQSVGVTPDAAANEYNDQFLTDAERLRRDKARAGERVPQRSRIVRLEG